jgi:hypothetical protein
VHQRSIRLRGRASIAAASVAILGIAAGVAYATIAGSGGVINSCYNASSNPYGQLRVIDAEAGAKCAKNEKALAFDMTGPRATKESKESKASRATRGFKESRESRESKATRRPRCPWPQHK